ncbi:MULTISPECIES: hypothetical protein [Atopobiaceae]|uniref:Uncharacterized protein n=1 Tax=Parafannyhessea umbonata TaxID=604330 RepID=A0A1H9QMW4_9ACTN|nr:MULTISPECIES: hypothetical protein [Atopobiaceae]SEH60293.1 hypothetical protein SAMN05216447_1072 [Parafannyhessea umbonata]SER61802.1 hypothetical protein SAMN05216446_1492 [Parafannyhessea umbonata]SJZ81523.1 hypothetical protein SAMN06298223_1506 [Olsenella sp. KH1P3]
MAAECRNLKMACIAALIFGIVSFAAGVFYIVVAPTTTQSYVVAADGLALAYMGFQGARRINVPSNAPAIMNMCSVIVLVSFVCAAFLMLNHEKIILQVVIGGIGLVLSLLAFVLARKISNIQKSM